MRVLDGIFLALFGVLLGGGCISFFMLPKLLLKEATPMTYNEYVTKTEMQGALNVAAKEINSIKAWIQSVRPPTPTPAK